MAKTDTDTGQIHIKNRDLFPQFIPSPTEEYKIKTRVKSVRFVRRSPDEDYKKLKKENAQIDITSPELYVNGFKKPIDGIFSPKFGADATQDTPIYTCDCHKTTGGAKRGHICPFCGTEVRTIETDLRITGHIDIAPFHVLTYHGYQAFANLLGTQKLEEIIKTVRRIDRSGKTVKDSLPTLLELYDDYEDEYLDKIGLDKKYVFMSKIPVYSARLRPLMQQGAGITMLDVNKRYLSIVRLAGVVKSSQFMPNLKREVEIQRTLNQIQKEWIDNDPKHQGVCNIIAKLIKGKEGVFRHALTSGRLDYSSRLVITLGQDLMAHEVDIPYQTMMVEMEEEIANYYSRLHDVSLAKAISKVEENVVNPTPEFVKICKQILKGPSAPWAIVNRNPSITENSLILVRVRDIHEDHKDLTLHLSVDVLKDLGADWT